MIKQSRPFAAMPKNRISRRVADSDNEYFSPLGAALSRVAVSRDFFRRRIAVIRRPRHATIKRPRSGTRAHTVRTLAHDGPPDDPTNQSSAMSALAASAAYAAPGAARALRRCARARAARARARRDRRKNPFPGSFFDRRDGAPASPEAPPSPPARSARARVGGVPARPGASRARARALEARARTPARGAERPAEAASSGWWSLASHAAQHHARWWRGAPGAAAPRPRRSPGAPSAVGPREDALASRDPRSPPGRAPPLLADAPNHDAPARRSEATGRPRLLRVVATTRLVLLGSNDVFHVLFFSFRK